MPQHAQFEDGGAVGGGQTEAEVGVSAPDDRWDYDEANPDGVGGLVFQDEAVGVTVVRSERYQEEALEGQGPRVGWRAFLNTEGAAGDTFVRTFLNCVR